MKESIEICVLAQNKTAMSRVLLFPYVFYPAEPWNLQSDIVRTLRNQTVTKTGYEQNRTTATVETASVNAKFVNYGSKYQGTDKSANSTTLNRPVPISPSYDLKAK